MRIIILLFGLLTFQQDFPNPMNLLYIDITDDGKYLAGISADGVTVIDTETKKIVTKHQFGGGYARLLNIRISGDGQYLVWTRNWELFTATFSNNEIINIKKVPNARAWIDLEINYDGSRILATVDTPRRKSGECDPFQRLFMQIKRKDDVFSYKIIGATSQPCFWLNNGELLSDSSVIFQQKEALVGNTLKLIEAIPNGEEWSYHTIEEDAKHLIGQGMSENGELLTYDCLYYISKKNDQGVWQKEAILPKDYACIANWYAAISPDGKTVVWLRLYRKDDGNIQYSEFWITRKIENKWTLPKVFISTDEPRFIHSLNHFRLSNNNFAYVNKNGTVFLMPNFDEETELIKLEKSN